MTGRVSYNYSKILTFIVIFTLLLLVLAPFSSNTASADDEDTGVGILPIRPRITGVELEQNYGTHDLRFEIFHLNTWRHVKEVSVEFYSDGDLVRHYVFKQTEDLDRSVEVVKGDGLVDFESNSSEETETIEQRCSLYLQFQFSGTNYDRLTIRAEDHSGGTSKSTITFQGITTGRTMTCCLLPLLLLILAAIIYKTVKDTEGEVEEEDPEDEIEEENTEGEIDGA